MRRHVRRRCAPSISTVSSSTNAPNQCTQVRGGLLLIRADASGLTLPAPRNVVPRCWRSWRVVKEARPFLSTTSPRGMRAPCGGSITDPTGGVCSTREIGVPMLVPVAACATGTTTGNPISVGWVCRCAVGDTTFARNDTTTRRAPRRCGAPGSLPWVVSVRTPRARASGCGRHSRAHRCAPAPPV